MRTLPGFALLIVALGGCSRAISVGAAPGVGGDALCAAASATWRAALVDTGLAATDSFGTSTSLAADGAGHLAVAFGDEALRLGLYDPATAWTVLIFSTFGRGFEEGTGSVARLDHAGRAVVAVPHRESPSGIDVRLGDGTVISLTMDSGVVTDIDLALDGADRPQLAFDDSDHGLGFAAWNGSTWHVESVGTGAGPEVALALDAAGRPVIAHSTLDDRLELARRGDDGTWTVETIVQTPMSPIHSPSLVTSALGLPALTWIDQRSWTLMYGVRADAGWEIEKLGCAGEAEQAALALDGAARPHVAFAARTGLSGLGHPTPLSAPLQHAVRADGAWSIEAITDATQSAGWPSIAVGADGVARVTWYDFASGSVRYAERD